jgi:peptide/nickel transport system substrate-binding protein
MNYRKIAKALAVGLCMAMLAGCGDSAKDTKTDTGTDEKTLTLAFPSTISSIDVLDGDGGTMLKEVAGVIETLVNVDSDFELQPSLATEWERTGEKTWVFKLRDDVTFHDGTPFNAEAVKWCLDRSLKENESLAKTTGIDTVEAVDDYTIQFNMSESTGELPEALTNVGTAIVAKSSVNDSGEFETAVGTGFFKQESFDVGSGTFTCVPYDKYYKDVDTNVTKRQVVSIADSSTRSLSAQNHEVDVATDVPFSDLETLKNTEGIQVQQFNTARTYFYSYNVNKEYLKDAKVRKALIYAINRDELVKDVLLGVGGVPEGVFIKDMPWANTDVDTYDYDAKKAQAMLEEAGFSDSDGDGILDKDGEKLSIHIVTGSRRPGNALIAQATQGYFESIGVEASVEVLDGNAYNEAIEKGNFDLCLSSAATGYVPSASYYLETYYHSGSSNSKSIGYSNPELDKLIEQCKAADRGDAKNELSKQAQAIAQEDAVVYTVADYGAVFVLSGAVENFSYSAAVHDFIVPNEVSLK